MQSNLKARNAIGFNTKLIEQLDITNWCWALSKVDPKELPKLNLVAASVDSNFMYCNYRIACDIWNLCEWSQNDVFGLFSLCGFLVWPLFANPMMVKVGNNSFTVRKSHNSQSLTQGLWTWPERWEPSMSRSFLFSSSMAWSGFDL